MLSSWLRSLTTLSDSASDSSSASANNQQSLLLFAPAEGLLSKTVRLLEHALLAAFCWRLLRALRSPRQSFRNAVGWLLTSRLMPAAAQKQIAQQIEREADGAVKELFSNRWPDEQEVPWLTRMPDHGIPHAELSRRMKSLSERLDAKPEQGRQWAYVYKADAPHMVKIER